MLSTLSQEKHNMKIDQLPTRPLLITLLLFALMVPTAFAQANTARVSTDAELSEDLAAGPCKSRDRLDAVKKLFIKMGVAEADLKSEEVNGVQNVTVIKKGKSEETVIIGAHYDKVADGCGIIDNWSGIVILAHLYRTLSKSETQKTYIFVAFDKEEVGLKGSAAMAKAIPKEKRPSYCSMVNLDSFGLGYPVILENASSTKMIKAAKALGTELKVPVTGLDLTGVANADSASFKDKDIPAITLSALSANWPQIMHSSNDKLENVVAGSVRLGYEFTLRYVIQIDTAACSVYK